MGCPGPSSMLVTVQPQSGGHAPPSLKGRLGVEGTPQWVCRTLRSITEYWSSWKVKACRETVMLRLSYLIEWDIWFCIRLKTRIAKLNHKTRNEARQQKIKSSNNDPRSSSAHRHTHSHTPYQILRKPFPNPTPAPFPTLPTTTTPLDNPLIPLVFMILPMQ